MNKEYFTFQSFIRSYSLEWICALDWLISSTVLLALQLEPACIFTILTASPILESVLVSSPGFVSLSDSKYFILILENAESESLVLRSNELSWLFVQRWS